MPKRANFQEAPNMAKKSLKKGKKLSGTKTLAGFGKGIKNA